MWSGSEHDAREPFDSGGSAGARPCNLNKDGDFSSPVKPSMRPLRKRDRSGDKEDRQDTIISNSRSAFVEWIPDLLIDASVATIATMTPRENPTEVAVSPHDVAESRHTGSVRNDTSVSFDKDCTDARTMGERYRKISEDFRRITGLRGPMN
jgi:hypothetical protein